jgi:hypothetical protein
MTGSATWTTTTSTATSACPVGGVRAARGNLKSVLGDVWKPDLADELWPVLEKRINEARLHGTERWIPMVRVLDRALELAHEYPRRGIVLSLDERRE